MKLQEGFPTCKEVITAEDFPAGTTEIPDHAFYGCSSLTSITLPDGVTSIGDHAFAECSSLTCVYGSQSVYDLAVNARASSANICTYPPSPAPSSPALSSAEKDVKANTGAIVGGVVGGCCLLIAMSLCVYFRKRGGERVYSIEMEELCDGATVDADTVDKL